MNFGTAPVSSQNGVLLFRFLHKYPRARVVHVPCAKEGVQELDRPESVLARNGWWEIKAVGDGERRFRARACERGRDNGILCRLEHGGLWWCTHRIRFWSDAHAKPGLYVCSQFKHRPWRQCTGCHPVTFSFRNISPVCPLWSTRPTIRELSKIRWLDLLYVHSINFFFGRFEFLKELRATARR